jgi:hypothetical protein
VPKKSKSRRFIPGTAEDRKALELEPEPEPEPELEFDPDDGRRTAYSDGVV